MFIEDLSERVDLSAAFQKGDASQKLFADLMPTTKILAPEAIPGLPGTPLTLAYDEGGVLRKPLDLDGEFEKKGDTKNKILLL